MTGSEKEEKVTLEHKRWLRSEAKKIAGSLDPGYMDAASGTIVDEVLASSAYRMAGTVFCYMSFGTEVRTDRLIRTALADGKRVCIPLCRGKGIMDARHYTGGDDLTAGAYGISEPRADSETVPRDEIDLAIIPCVTCDRSLRRLGHGAGYYDRYLEGGRLTKAALCFERLLADEIPTDAFDISMDAVVTEKETYGDL